MTAEPNRIKRPGRPPKSAREQLCHVISFRVSADDLALLAERAANAGQPSVSEYSRAASLGAPLAVRRQSDPAMNAAAVAALNRIGVNLNQLARRLNGGRYVRYAEIEALIARIDRMIDELLSK